MRIFGTFILIFSVINAYASSADCNETTIQALAPVMEVAEAAQAECSNPKKLNGLCMYVGGREKDPQPQGRFVWKYQKKILEAACVDIANDDEATIAEKVARVWKENENKLVCNNTQFDVVNGNLIKYAVNMKFDEFLLDMVEWKVDLNKVDDFDKRTVLDYVEYQMERMKGTPSELILKRYYQILSDAGAKHKKDL